MIMSQPLVSVIIPIYKVEEFLPDCLESVIHQTYSDLEIICVNDGSPDRCEDILKDYAMLDRRIKVINKVNGGLSSARNAALPVAQGEYVFFLDSDDWLSLDCIENLVKDMLRSKADIACVHDILSYYQPKRIDRQRMLSGHESGTFEITNEILKQLWVVAWGKLYRRQTLLDLGMKFPEGYIYEDEYFHHVLLPHLKKIVISDGGAYYYRQRDNSIMSSRKLRSGKDNLVIFQRIFDYYKEQHWMGKFDLPGRILVTGFTNNENPSAYYEQVKALLHKLGVSYDNMARNELLKGLMESADYKSYCRCETCCKVKKAVKGLRKSLLRLKIGRKTHIALLGLTLFHKAKGERTVLFGFKL